jgi:hypothetical protein
MNGTNPATFNARRFVSITLLANGIGFLVVLPLALGIAYWVAA